MPTVQYLTPNDIYSVEPCCQVAYEAGIAMSLPPQDVNLGADLGEMLALTRRRNELRPRRRPGVARRRTNPRAQESLDHIIDPCSHSFVSHGHRNYQPQRRLGCGSPHAPSYKMLTVGFESAAKRRHLEHALEPGSESPRNELLGPLSPARDPAPVDSNPSVTQEASLQLVQDP